MALAMAKNGGIGVLHRNLDAQAQAQMVKWIRKKINSDGMIDKPITFRPNDYYSYLQKVHILSLSLSSVRVRVG
jgi:IMP dehydrogenase/GMP reductase